MYANKFSSQIYGGGESSYGDPGVSTRFFCVIDESIS